MPESVQVVAPTTTNAINECNATHIATFTLKRKMDIHDKKSTFASDVVQQASKQISHKMYGELQKCGSGVDQFVQVVQIYYING